MTKIVHLSSVHNALDTRIFYRFCSALSEKYKVIIIACHPQREILRGIEIRPFRKYRNRHIRIFFSWLIMFVKAVKTDASIYHLHDPELIPCGLLLKLIGKKVIWDIHENIAEDIFDKPWIKFQRLAYGIFTLFEKPACRYFQIILAETSYEKRYKNLSQNAITIHNYCDVNFFKPYVIPDRFSKVNHLYYIGIILENRGILQICEALHKLNSEGGNYHFHCVGELYSQLDTKIRALPFYSDIKSNLHFYGLKNLEEGYVISAKCGIGLAIIHPMSNSVESYPTKLFEYMAIGMPVITSDFPLYNSVVIKFNCGFTVNPMDVTALAEKIREMSVSETRYNEMALNGYSAVNESFNWLKEKEKLLQLYAGLESS